MDGPAEFHVIRPAGYYKYLSKTRLAELEQLFDKYLETTDWLAYDNLSYSVKLFVHGCVRYHIVNRCDIRCDQHICRVAVGYAIVRGF